MNFTNPPLSGSDIKRRFNGNTKVLLNDKLAQYDDIDKLLAPYGHCFILLRSNPGFGHWICLMKWPEHNVVSFFDSYGDFPDDQMQFVNSEFLVQSGQAFNYICRLLSTNRQHHCPHVATCLSFFCKWYCENSTVYLNDALWSSLQM